MSVDKEAIEGNKLILGFDSGYTEDAKSADVSDLKYHTSWDWLMPVVTKIWQGVKEGEFPLEKNREYAFLHSPIYTSINTVWKDVVDFIKFYNTNK